MFLKQKDSDFKRRNSSRTMSISSAAFTVSSAKHPSVKVSVSQCSYRGQQNTDSHILRHNTKLMIIAVVVSIILMENNGNNYISY